MAIKRRIIRPEKIPFTQEGYDKLQIELEELQASRKGAVETLSAARSLGDLSENGLYTAAKGRLRSIDTEINRRKYYLKVGVVEETQRSAIGIGKTVVVSDGTKERVFQIVGDTESDPLNGKITQKSPIGSALLGKNVKDSVTITTPSGHITYTIKKIS
jgi:transcription elongation factor GreA